MMIEVEIFNALAHPERLKIIELLRDGEACVCHIQSMLAKRQAYVSQHLNILKQAGLVTSRKDGLRVYYQISDSRWFAVIEQVQAILKSLHAAALINEVDVPETARPPCNCPQCQSKREDLTHNPKDSVYA